LYRDSSVSSIIIQRIWILVKAHGDSSGYSVLLSAPHEIVVADADALAIGPTVTPITRVHFELQLKACRKVRGSKSVERLAVLAEIGAR
jgi:hypothetical protein